MERESEFLEDDLIEQIDWNQLFEELPESANVLELESESPAVADSSASWINEIEKVLMKDDDDDDKRSSEPDDDFCQNFLADILVDSPSGDSLDIAAASTDSDPNFSGKEKVDVDSDANDPLSKKRRRQMRNRDAAVRSRERKKSYVKDLEMKSKYLEGECRRLGRLLQCCYSDNQALRFALHMANNAALSTKQESAVLFLESLLLGSLLWWVGIIIFIPLLLLLLVEDDNKNVIEKASRRREAERVEESLGDAVLKPLVKSRRTYKAYCPKKKKKKIKHLFFNILFAGSPLVF